VTFYCVDGIIYFAGFGAGSLSLLIFQLSV